MGTLSLLPLSISSLLLNQTQSLLKPHQINPPNPLKINSISLSRTKGVVPIGSNSNGSQFVDEDGIIEDMDGYMNHLSLEYDSVWDTKPSWLKLCCLNISPSIMARDVYWTMRYMYNTSRGMKDGGMFRQQSPISVAGNRCQPWTITLTGALVIACSWIVLHSIVITTLAVSLIGAWWYIFLYSYPKAYTEMIAERRKKVNSGVEDTFGIKKS